MNDIRPSTIEQFEDSWFGEYPFGAHRNYRLFSRRQQNQLARASLKGGEILVLSGGQSAIAGLACRMLEWDSCHLGRPCARLGPLFWVGEVTHEELARLLREGLDHLKAAGAEHIVFELDASDTLGLRASQSCGFQLLDTRLTYLGTKQSEFKRPGRARFELREFQPADRAAVLDIAAKMFPTITGRFSNDPTLSPETAKEVYLTWFTDCLAEDSDYRVELALRQGEVVGFLAFRLLSDIYENTGKRIFGRGLSAVLPDARGAYVDLLYETIFRNYELGEAIEFEASITNPRSFRVFERLGLGLVRTRYTLLSI